MLTLLSYFPESKWQRCIAHFYRNIFSMVPKGKVREEDLSSAYGAPPTGAETLLRLAELRILATLNAVRAVTRHDDDIIFAAEQPQALGRLFTGSQGTVRIVGVPDRRGLTAVYYRPPKAYLDGESILTVLIHRLRTEPEPAASVM